MKAKLLSTSCVLGSCPSIFESDGTYIIVGKVIPKTNLADNVVSKIGEDEIAVEIPRNLLEIIFNKK